MLFTLLRVWHRRASSERSPQFLLPPSTSGKSFLYSITRNTNRDRHVNISRNSITDVRWEVPEGKACRLVSSDAAPPDLTQDSDEQCHKTLARRVLIIVPGVGRQLPPPVCRLVAHGCERRRHGERLGGVCMPSGGHGLGMLVAPELPVALHEKHRRLQGTPADQGRESVSAGRLNHHNRSPHSPKQRIALAGRSPLWGPSSALKHGAQPQNDMGLPAARRIQGIMVL